jgi:hypothetical protein
MNCPWRYTDVDEHKTDREANKHDQQWKRLGREHNVCVERVMFAQHNDPKEEEWRAQRNGSTLRSLRLP